MRKFVILAIAGILLSTFAVTTACTASTSTILEDLKLPAYPGTKLDSEIDLPQGPVLDKIKQEFDPMLAMTSLKQVSVATFSIDGSVQAPELIKFYEPKLKDLKWTASVRRVERSGSAVWTLTNQQIGMLIFTVDNTNAKDRNLTIIRITGTLDAGKLKNDVAGPPQLESFRVDPGIPTSQPIAISPSNKLDLQSLGSDINSRIWSQDSVQLTRASDSGRIGEMSRTGDGRLLIALAPRLQMDEVVIPSGLPVMIELNGGSLSLMGAGMRSNGLSITAEDASLTIQSFALAIGKHSIKSTGKPVSVAFSEVTGGILTIEAKGDVTLTLPKNASATIDVSAPSSGIRNQTGVNAQSSTDSSMHLKLGDGGAAITVKTSNGTVTIKN